MGCLVSRNLRSDNDPVRMYHSVDIFPESRRDCDLKFPKARERKVGEDRWRIDRYKSRVATARANVCWLVIEYRGLTSTCSNPLQFHDVLLRFGNDRSSGLTPFPGDDQPFSRSDSSRLSRRRRTTARSFTREISW